MAYEYLMVLNAYSRLNREEKKKYGPEVKSYSWLLSENETRKVRIARYVNYVFGIEAVSAFLGLYMKLRK
jgi:hypothetical protein